jgi:tRNA(Ile)-lysidine synthase TilS/MesJ
MALLDFLNRTRRVRRIIHVNHGTAMSPTFEALVLKHGSALGIPVHVVTLPHDIPATELSWSKARRATYAANELPVAVGHTFDDALEWWIYTSLRGNPKPMSPVNGNVFRPFLYARKAQTVQWCEDHTIPYIVDPTNVGDGNMRARLRTCLPALEAAVPAMIAVLRKSLYDGTPTKGCTCDKGN